MFPPRRLWHLGKVVFERAWLAALGAAPGGGRASLEEVVKRGKRGGETAMMWPGAMGWGAPWWGWLWMLVFWVVVLVVPILVVRLLWPGIGRGPAGGRDEALEILESAL